MCRRERSFVGRLPGARCDRSADRWGRSSRPFGGGAADRCADAADLHPVGSPRPGPASGDRVPGSCLVGGCPGCCRGGPGAGGVRRCCGPAVGGVAATGRDHGGHGVRAGRPASHAGSRAAGPASGAVMVTPSSRAARAARPAGHCPIGRSGGVRIQPRRPVVAERTPVPGVSGSHRTFGAVTVFGRRRSTGRDASIPREMEARPSAAIGVRSHRTRCGRALGVTGTRPRGLRHRCSRRPAVRGRPPSVLPTRCRPPVPVPGAAGRGPRPGHCGVGEPDDRSGGSELGSERRGR